MVPVMKATLRSPSPAMAFISPDLYSAGLPKTSTVVLTGTDIVLGVFKVELCNDDATTLRAVRACVLVRCAVTVAREGPAEIGKAEKTKGSPETSTLKSH